MGPTVDDIPFRTFTGHLKQHAHDELTAAEQQLFDVLFPAFEGTSAAQDAYAQAAADPMLAALGPLVELAPAERRPRRYAGYDLPRERYHSVCLDGSGNDSQTLAHELRAYRDPTDVGMVEVIDLASGCTLQIADREVRLDPQPAMAVLIHRPDALPMGLEDLDFVRETGPTGDPMLIYLFRYHVRECSIERAIDLRFPEVREWFFRAFRALGDDEGAMTMPLPGEGASPTIAYSQFHLDNGRAPTPDSFRAMLPTLLNPDIGGGDPSDTGGTLFAIGHWMRQAGVGAFVFPSARSDANALFEGGLLRAWAGWNLLDYRDSPLMGSDARVLTFILSPWAWVELPRGVRVTEIGAGSPVAGSIAVEGMVDYWARDYLNRVHGLEAARRERGRETEENLSLRCFDCGSLTMRWLRLAVRREPRDAVEASVQELLGVALPLGLYPVTGRVGELWHDVLEGARLDKAVGPLLTVVPLACASLRRRYAGQGLDTIARVGADLELSMFFLTLREMMPAASTGFPLDVSGILGEIDAPLSTRWLDDDVRTRARALHAAALQSLQRGTPDATRMLAEAVGLQEAIRERLGTGDRRGGSGGDEGGGGGTLRP